MRNRSKVWLALAVAALCGTISLPTAVAETADPPIRSGDLLVHNHSFEESLAGWTPTDGQGGPATCDDGLRVTTEGATDGANALAVGGRGCAGIGARSDAVAVTPGSVLQARAHAAGTDTAMIALVWLDASGATIDADRTTHPRGSDVITVDGTAPAGTAAVSIELGVRRSGSFDEVLITGPDVSVGPQITKPAGYLAMGSGEDETGRKVTFAVATGSTGSPAKLVISDILAGAVIKTVDLPGATGSWTVKQNPVSKIVYIGTYGSAALWSWTPGAEQAVRIGTPPIPHLGMVYGISFDSDGRVYGGGWGEPTAGYAGAALWRYDEQDGFLGSHGPDPLTDDANYTRWAAYDDVSDAIFTGTGTKPHLFGCPVDATTCTDLTSLLSPEQLALPWLYGGSAGDGYLTVWGGDSNSHGNDYLTVIKVGRDGSGAVTGQVITELKGVVYNGSTRPVDGKIYFNKAGETGLPLHSYDLTTGVETVLDQAPVNLYSRSWEVIDLEDPDWPGPSIVGWSSGGLIAAYNLQTQRFSRVQVSGNPQLPIAANSVAAGDDGRLWTAGYLTGGIGAYTPLRDDRQQTYLLGGQAEQMINYRGRVYQGIYPYGRIASFTPAEIAAGQGPRIDCTIGDHQNRPYGLAGHGDRVYFGSQADYGHDLGGFGYLDLTTGTCTTFPGEIGHQSINALAASGTKVFGAGSIFYSYDGEPVDDQANLVIFDETTGRVRTVPWPIAGTRSIDAAVTDADGTVWFAANGWLAALDPDTEQLSYSEEIFPDWKPGDRIPGNYGRLVRHPNGMIYGNLGGRLFGFDPRRTLRSSSVADSLQVLRTRGAGTHLAVDAYGDLYTVIGPRLLRTVPR